MTEIAGKRKLIETLVLILVCVMMASFGQVYMKLGLTNVGGIGLSDLLSQRLFSVLFEEHVFIGIGLYAFSAILWLVVLSGSELSFAYPLVALGYLVTAFLSRYYFGENINIVRWLGILLILGGVFLISKS